MPIEKPNFIATTVRGREPEACREAKNILIELGDASPKVEVTDVSGLIFGLTSLDVMQLPDMLKKLVSSDPWKMHLIQRFIPIQEVTDSTIESIVDSAKKLSGLVGKKETFKVQVEKRHSEIDAMKLIKEIAAIFDQKVNLEEPDKVILVEVVGRIAGVSVLEPEKIFSSVVAKRGSI
ncbi:MAG: THUMP domain-containing protein [Conexivisphaerales archaeon]